MTQDFQRIPHPKISTNFQSSATIWKTSVQTYETVGNIPHSNHKAAQVSFVDILFFRLLRKLPFVRGTSLNKSKSIVEFFKFISWEFHTYSYPPISSFQQITLPISCPFIKNNILGPLSTAHLSTGMGLLSRNGATYQWSYQKKNYFPSLVSHKLLRAPELEVGPPEPLPHPGWNFGMCWVSLKNFISLPYIKEQNCDFFKKANQKTKYIKVSVLMYIK